MLQPANMVQSHNAVPMSGQRRRLWINIETALGEYQSHNAVPMSGQRRRLWIKIETGLGEFQVFR